MSVELLQEVLEYHESRNLQPRYRDLQRWQQNNPSVRLGLVNLPPQAQGLVTPLAWPSTIVDRVNERIRLRGFRSVGSVALDAQAAEWSRINKLISQSIALHAGVLTYGVAYLTIAASDVPGVPSIVAESPLTLSVKIDPRTCNIVAAARIYGKRKEYATLYTDQTIEFYENVHGIWTLNDFVQHDAGVVPVVAFRNTPELDSEPRSEFMAALPLITAAVRALTNTQLAAEAQSTPLRVMAGVSQDDFMDPSTGLIKSSWETYTSSFLALADTAAKVTQLPAADLANFTEVIRLYARLVASVTGIPLHHFFAELGGNPQSADAAAIIDQPLTMRAERKIALFSDLWSDTMAIAGKMVGVNVGVLEPVFAEPSFSTFASVADGGSKLVAAGIVSREWVLERFGLSPEEMRLEAERLQSSSGAQLLKGLGLA